MRRLPSTAPPAQARALLRSLHDGARLRLRTHRARVGLVGRRVDVRVPGLPGRNVYRIGPASLGRAGTAPCTRGCLIPALPTRRSCRLLGGSLSLGVTAQCGLEPVAARCLQPCVRVRLPVRFDSLVDVGDVQLLEQPFDADLCFPPPARPRADRGSLAGVTLAVFNSPSPRAAGCSPGRPYFHPRDRSGPQPHRYLPVAGDPFGMFPQVAPHQVVHP